jgi:signal transduction histidine kinase/ActR/RegA family two-component response regulator
MNIRRSVLTLVVAIIVIGTSISYWLTRDLLRSVVDDREKEKVGHVATTVESLVKEYSEGAQMTARVLSQSERLAQALGSPDAAESREAFASILLPLVSERYLDILEIVDSREVVRYRAHDSPRAGDRAQLWGVAEALQGKSGMVAHMKPDGAAVLAIEPVLLHKRIVGAVIAGRRLDERFVTELGGKVNAGLALMSRSGVLASTGGIARGALDRAAVEDAFHQKVPVYRTASDGRARVVYIPLLIVDEGFVMMVKVDSGGAFRALEESFLRELKWMAALLLASIAIAAGLIGIVLRPLRNLRSRAERIAVAATGESIASKGKDEIASVVQVLDTLTGRLVEQNRALARSRAEAQAASEAKSRFLSSMSHEIRTPLNGVLGMAELLRGTSLTAEQARYCQVITASGHALYDLLGDILDFSKIEAGKVRLEEIDFDLGRLLGDVTSAFSEIASRRGNRFVSDLDIPLPGCFRGDPTRLRQVVSNLLGNAVKFTTNGEITFRVSAIGHRAGDPRTWLRFSVHDSGIGIPPEKMKVIFEAFAQADDSTTRQYGGTGLGLVITRHLVELMGGTVNVESAPGAGSRFWFDVPLAPAKSVAAARSAGASMAQRVTARVLLAEDNPTNQEVICAMLSHAGADVVPVENGELAVQALRRESFDIVLMDCHMPVMDGYEAARRIRGEEAPGSRIPIVALTANAFSDNRERCLAAGMDDYLTKPVSLAQLSAMVGRWTGGNEGPKPAC